MDANLSLYRIFHSVAAHQNISRASKELYISQPAVSKAIRKLEEQMSTTLFVRSSKGVTLTDEGKVLFQYTSSAFDQLEKGTKQIEKMQSLGVGQIRIGASTTLCKYILLPYLQVFIEKHPHVNISITCQSTFETVKLLNDDKIDIGLIGSFNTTKNLVFSKVGDIQDTFVATESYLENLKQRNPQITNILSECNLMLLNENNISRRYMNQFFESQNIEAKQILEISNMDLLIDFAKIGLGVACVIKEFVADEIKNGDLTELLLSAPIPKRGVGFAYSSRSSFNKSVKLFIEEYENYS